MLLEFLRLHQFSIGELRLFVIFVVLGVDLPQNHQLEWGKQEELKCQIIAFCGVQMDQMGQESSKTPELGRSNDIRERFG